jgi:enoyl-CoA hydratase/carnithine racemase
MVRSYETIELTVSGHVGRIVLDRPARHNAQNEVMWQELATAGAELADIDEVRVVVLSGKGPSFSSGIDLAEMAPGGFLDRLRASALADVSAAVPGIEAAQRSIDWMRTAPFLVVAQVHGTAIGAGFQLALAADVRIVAQDCAMALKEVQYGLIPDLGATATLPRLIGTQMSLDLILTGRSITGEEAQTLGIAQAAVPEAELSSATEHYIGQVVRNSRTAIAAVKSAVYEPNPARSLAIAALGQAECLRVIPNR